MNALTLHQPWASLVALGAKSIETRSWATAYRGPLAIHAGKRKPRERCWGKPGALNFDPEPIVCPPGCCGSGIDSRFQRYCRVCEGVGRCDPVPACGRQGLWEWTTP